MPSGFTHEIHPSLEGRKELLQSLLSMANVLLLPTAISCSSYGGHRGSILRMNPSLSLFPTWSLHLEESRHLA